MKAKRRNWIRLITLLILVILAIAIDWPSGLHLHIPAPSAKIVKSFPFVQLGTNGYLLKLDNDFKIKEGLDLQGGSHLVYVADLSKIPDKEKNDAMDSLKAVIEKRVNGYGVSEAVVYTSKTGNEYRVTAELPGIKDIETAKKNIGEVAKLEFKEASADGQTFVETGLTGSDFKRADVAFDQNTNQPYIAIQFNDSGSKKFEQITGRNIGKPLAIYLDGNLISAPNVNQQISGGNAQITGKFTYQEAKDLAIKLNAGALPVPISIAEQRTVDATLGKDSIQKSIFAGVLGIIVVCLFMLAYYRFLGVFSTIGVGFYILFMIAIIKLSTLFPGLGITLTMGGVAGMILSIGMSMETDVLIFERIREEMRGGRSFAHSWLLGFRRAWASIRDSNVVSMIIAIILATWGTSMIKGFAIVLAIGIVVGLLTTFLGTRALIELFGDRKFMRNNWLLDIEKDIEEKK